jgi:hypothetical protein
MVWANTYSVARLPTPSLRFSTAGWNTKISTCGLFWRHTRMRAAIRSGLTDWDGISLSCYCCATLFEIVLVGYSTSERSEQRWFRSLKVAGAYKSHVMLETEKPGPRWCWGCQTSMGPTGPTATFQHLKCQQRQEPHRTIGTLYRRKDQLWCSWDFAQSLFACICRINHVRISGQLDVADMYSTPP